jgi:hypothetical protein
MANGNGRDLGRLIATLSDFRAVHGHWPTRVRSPQWFITSLRGILTEKGYQQLESKITLVPGSSDIIAEDDCGLKFSYGDYVENSRGSADIYGWLGSLECHPGED